MNSLVLLTVISLLHCVYGNTVPQSNLAFAQVILTQYPSTNASQFTLRSGLAAAVQLPTSGVHLCSISPADLTTVIALATTDGTAAATMQSLVSSINSQSPVSTVQTGSASSILLGSVSGEGAQPGPPSHNGGGGSSTIIIVVVVVVVVIVVAIVAVLLVFLLYSPGHPSAAPPQPASRSHQIRTVSEDMYRQPE